MESNQAIIFAPELLHNIGRYFLVNHGWTNARDDPFLYTEEEALSKDTLLSCSRVCHAFRLATLPYLFHTLCFYINAEITEETRDEDDPDCRCRSLRGLRRLAETHSAVRENIQEVRIRSGCIAHQDAVFVDPAELITTLHGLPKLRVVWLHELCFQSGTVSSVTRAPLPSLASLSITSAGQLDVGAVGTIIGSFSAITRVAVGDSCCASSEDEGGQEASTPHTTSYTKIDTLEAIPFADNFHILLAYLSENVMEPGSLKSLQLEGSTEMFELSALGKFLEFTGASIVDMTLRLYPFQQDQYDPALALACCQKLERLTIDWDIESDEAPETLNALVSALRMLPRLTVITLSVCALESTHEDTDIDVEHFKPIEEALLQLGALEKVVLRLGSKLGVRPGWYSEFVEECAPTLLPNLYGRNMLEF